MIAASELFRRRSLEIMGVGPRWVLRAPPAHTAPESHDAGTATPQASNLETALPQSVRFDLLQQQERVQACTACPRAAERQNAVFGRGGPAVKWMVVGDVPSAEDDEAGVAGSGVGGRLLQQMLAALGFDSKNEIFLTHAVKCRSSRESNPSGLEILACRGHLTDQLEFLAPKMVIAMGAIAANSLLGRQAPLADARGTIHWIEIGGRTVPVVVTFGPEELLANPLQKAAAWEDLCLARAQ